MKKQAGLVEEGDVILGWKVLHVAYKKCCSTSVLLILEHPVPSRGTDWVLYDWYDQVEVAA